MYDTNLSAIEHKLFQATEFVSQRTYRTLTFFGELDSGTGPQWAIVEGHQHLHGAGRLLTAD